MALTLIFPDFVSSNRVEICYSHDDLEKKWHASSSLAQRKPIMVCQNDLTRVIIGACKGTQGFPFAPSGRTEHCGSKNKGNMRLWWSALNSAWAVPNHPIVQYNALT